MTATDEPSLTDNDLLLQWLDPIEILDAFPRMEKTTQIEWRKLRGEDKTIWFTRAPTRRVNAAGSALAYLLRKEAGQWTT